MRGSASKVGRIVHASLNGSRLGVRFEGAQEAWFDGIWLRDHCREGRSMTASTEQRLTDTLTIPLDLAPSSCEVSGDGLTVHWPASEADPEGGSSSFDAAFLAQAAYSTLPVPVPVSTAASYSAPSAFGSSARAELAATFGQTADPALPSAAELRTPWLPQSYDLGREAKCPLAVLPPGDAGSVAAPADGALGAPASTGLSWAGRSSRSLPMCPLSDLQAAGSGAAAGLDAVRALASQGWLLVSEVPATEEGTAAVAEALFGEPMSTIYGHGLWKTEIRPGGGNDTAYTSLPLPPHADGCYMADQPAFQMFHCLQQAASGGDSTLVDGLAIAALLGKAFPDSLEYFCRPDVALPYHHTDEHQRLLHRRPVFALAEGCSPADAVAAAAAASEGEGANSHARSLGHVIERVHFNDVDRAVLSGQQAPLSAIGDMRAFYRHWKRLLWATLAPELRLTMTLAPGTVLVFDNQRCLHGRTAFDAASSRVLSGSYGSREAFDARLRARAAYPPWSLRN
ncbi:hypothetical protein FNF27_02659 [Cafeteria roenbergensis]|uniref:TauD/TfdA-like domain-containing protein n=1 Tax=Cafeteria roenbergensis TaxID=33653 RepID=A0A5A8CBV2_CAFRO|nr:hypothetical protein FNF29_05158 [Cafeteria roenbergensis]KAA0175938.1 hypothetical protein FNF27_02659 [Cafeteria roenbergensis]|mmetsp:Transcript_9639/g.37535  ORF Transcript_9639/g.37535 Transcript_9639/m.37535 type:complete len:512 (+) Transcript_9639:81-1616(+)|eukprot:KAA0150583.1 hypothetical protein FNF29_05158 [Cafeteria roenbergensis]